MTSQLKPPKNSCVWCPFTLKKNQDRVLRISSHPPIYDRLRVIRLSWRGKILGLARPVMIELGFAHNKENHSLRYARYRGQPKVKTSFFWVFAFLNAFPLHTSPT